MNNKVEKEINMKTDIKTDGKREMLTKTSIPILITKLAIPTIISMLVTAVYNMADTYFVGKISTQATAAVGLVFSVMAIIQALGFFYGQGSGTFVSRALGANNKKEAEEMAATAFALAIISGIIVTVLGNVFINQLSLAVGADEVTISETREYMSVILMGAPFFMGQFVINNQLRFQGNAMFAMIGLMVGALANILLDPILILVFHMGVRGAGIATISGQILSFFVLLYISFKGDGIKLKLSCIRINPYYVKEIINGGAASFCRQGLTALAALLLNRYSRRYGSVSAVAAMTITTRVTMMLVSAVIGFGQGYQPVCSYNYGARLTDRVKQGYFFCIKWGTVFVVCVSTLCFIFAPDIVRFMRNDGDVISIGKMALRYQMVVLPTMVTIIMTNMMLQSIGSGLKATITSSARSGIFFIPLIIILPRIFGLTGVLVTQAVADLCSFSIAIPFAYSELKKM